MYYSARLFQLIKLIIMTHKSILLFIILISLNLFAKAGFDGDPSDRQQTIDSLEEMYFQSQEYHTTAKNIFQQFEQFDTKVIKSEYEKCLASITQIDDIYKKLVASAKGTANPDFETLRNQYVKEYRQVQVAINNMNMLREFYNQIEVKKSIWRTKYFRMIEINHRKKKSIDKLYYRETSRNFHYGGMTNYAIVDVRKKQIYTPLIKRYDEKVLHMKAVNDTDYPMKIKLLEEMKELLTIADKLFYVPTRKLERQLRKTDDINTKIQIMRTFEPEED